MSGEVSHRVFISCFHAKLDEHTDRHTDRHSDRSRTLFVNFLASGRKQKQNQTRLIQVVTSCRTCHALHAMSCPAMPCHALSCPVKSCHTLLTLINRQKCFKSDPSFPLPVCVYECPVEFLLPGVCVCVCVCVWVWCGCVYVCMCVYVYAWVCVRCVCVCLCLYVVCLHVCSPPEKVVAELFCRRNVIDPGSEPSSFGRCQKILFSPHFFYEVKVCFKMGDTDNKIEYIFTISS